MNFLRTFALLCLFVRLRASESDYMVRIRASEIDYTKTIRTSGGDVVGEIRKSESGRSYNSFQAIPYADTPVRENRFDYSKLGRKWEGTFHATEEGAACAQSAHGFYETEEDCLHLSVYTPELPEETSKKDKLPVIIWFHGGAFVSGKAANYKPHLMMNKNLVLVVPQYRLGLFGFYSMNRPNISGNMGMLDQVESLKWVQLNIEAFGGDPSRVTLAGDCAGGASALYHMISPVSRGLFSRVISLSGSPLNYWSTAIRHKMFMLIFCLKQKCPPHDYYFMKEWLRDQVHSPLKGILDSQELTLLQNDPFIGNYRLAVEIQKKGFEEAEHLFMTQHPLTALRRKNFTKVPVLLGVTKDVGNYIVDMSLYTYAKIRKQKYGEERTENELFSLILSENDISLSDEDGKKIIKDYYMPEWGKTKTFVESLQDVGVLLGDIAYNSGILETAKLLSEDVPTRLFSFGYDGGPKLFDLRNEDVEDVPPMQPGVSLGDDLFFFLPEEEHVLTKEQKKVSETMLDMFENFAYGREPLNEWPEFTTSNLESMIIDADGRIKLGERFVTKDREQKLSEIFSLFKSVHYDYESEPQWIAVNETKMEETSTREEL